MRTVAFILSLVFIFMIPWEDTVDLPGLGTLAKMIGIAMAACWLASVVVRRGFREPGPFHLAFLLFVLWNAVSVFWSTDVNQTVTLLLTWVQLLGLVLILWDLYTTRATLLFGLQAYILGAYVAIGIAVANYFAGNVLYAHYQRFSSGGDTHPDGFGFILALGIPAVWYIVCSKSPTKISRMLKWINYTYIPAAFLGITLSGTRTAVIAAIPGMAFGLVSLTRLQLSKRIPVFVFFTLVFLILLPQVQTTRSFQRLGTTGNKIIEGDFTGRTDLWRAGLVSFAEHPLLGVGSNMYRSVNRLGKLAHNSFLSVLVEVGLIGFALFGIVLTIAIVYAWRQPKWDSRFWLTTLVVWAIGAFTLTYEYRKATWLILSLLIANAALTCYRDETEELEKRKKPKPRFIPHNKRSK